MFSELPHVGALGTYKVSIAPGLELPLVFYYKLCS